MRHLVDMCRNTSPRPRSSIDKDEPVTSYWLNFRAFREAVEQPQVLAACIEAQAAVDAMLQANPLRRPSAHTPVVVAALRESANEASATLMGAELSRAAYRGIRGDGSPLAGVIAAAEALVTAGVTDAKTFQTSPLRALARWHVLATANSDVAEAERGRPRSSNVDVVEDPLNLRITPTDAAEVVNVLLPLVETADASAQAVASAVHGVIAAGQPFAHANAVIGRTAGRAVLVARGADADGLVPFEMSIDGSGRPQYVAALTALSRATSHHDSVAGWSVWMTWHCRHVAKAADLAARDITSASFSNSTPST